MNSVLRLLWLFLFELDDADENDSRQDGRDEVCDENRPGFDRKAINRPAGCSGDKGHVVSQGQVIDLLCADNLDGLGNKGAGSQNGGQVSKKFQMDPLFLNSLYPLAKPNRAKWQ